MVQAVSASRQPISLAALGVHVIVVGRNTERGQKAVAEIRAGGGKADFISSDLQDASSEREVARRAVELGGGHVDILINNAGVYPFGPTHESTEEMFEHVYTLNVKAPYFLVAELAPLISRLHFANVPMPVAALPRLCDALGGPRLLTRNNRPNCRLRK